MPHVYLLSEHDFDDQVYVYLLEAMLAARVEPIQVRLRRGGGIGEVRKKLRLLLSEIRRTGPTEDTFFLIGIDNDRAVEHPSHERLAHTSKEACRHCTLTRAIHSGLPDGWPIPGAIALPVQMIESWLLLMHDPDRYPQESSLPACTWSHQEAARALTAPTRRPRSRTSSKRAFALRSCPARRRSSRWSVSSDSTRKASPRGRRASIAFDAKCRSSSPLHNSSER